MGFYNVNLRVPLDREWNSNDAVTLMELLTARLEAFMLAIRALGSKGTVWEIEINTEEKALTELFDSILGIYPQAEWQDNQEFLNTLTEPTYQRIIGFQPPLTDYWGFEQIITAHDLKTFDPLIQFTQLLDDNQEGELVSVCFEIFTIRNDNDFWQERQFKLERLLRQRGDKELEDKEKERLIARVRERVYGVTPYLILNTPQKSRLSRSDALKIPIIKLLQFEPHLQVDVDQLDRRLGTVKEWINNDPLDVLSDFARNKVPGGLGRIGYAWNANKLGYALILTPTEIAALWHVPNKRFEAQSIVGVTQEKTLPDALKNIEGMLIGHDPNEVDVRLPVEDRTTHTMIIGKNGTGKSSLMHRMIHEDIAAGRGVCVVDPHGELVSNILRASIPNERIDDVVVLDLSMALPTGEMGADGKSELVRYPPPLNPLYKTQDGAVSLNIIGTLSRIYTGFAETQMAYLLSMALKTLAAETNPTLLDVHLLFEDSEYRERLVRQVTSLNLSRQWSKFEARTPRQKEEDTFPLFRRLDSFYDNNQTLAITCHPDPINIHDLVASNKVILVSVGAEGNSIGKNERLILGSSIVSQIEAAATSGALRARPFMLYIDETQSLVNTPLNEMLAEVRKFGLGLVLANQFLAQLTGETQDAVEGNVGTMFCFEIGHSDARAMKHYMTTFEADELTALGKFKAAASMRYQGDRQPAFLLHTLPPPQHEAGKEEAKERERYIRQRSVENHTPKTYDEVMDWLRGEGDNGDRDTDEPDDPSPTDDDNPEYYE